MTNLTEREGAAAQGETRNGGVRFGEYKESRRRTTSSRTVEGARQIEITRVF